MLKPVISHLRENGYRVVIFLDDFLLIGSSVEAESVCLDSLSLEIYCKAWDLSLMSINPSLFQSRALFIWESLLIQSLTLSLPDEKVDKILCACQILLTCVNPSVREVAHVIGLLVSAFPAVNFLKLHYRSTELCKSQAVCES